jgi:hypothetical protein
MEVLNIDHIVYIVPDLEKALDHLEEVLGIRPSIGGRHLDRGTKNALLHIGHQSYLEILAADPENVDFQGERWMGIDLMDKPCISRWCLSSDQLEEEARLLKSWNPQMGKIQQCRRISPAGIELQWQMILPLAHPVIDVVPFFIDWSTSEKHPCDDLPRGCRLEEITFAAPQQEALNKQFTDYFKDALTFGPSPKIHIQIRGPKGILRLS